MFIWDFIVESLLEEVFKWIHSQIVIFLTEIFGAINMMGAELFDLVWIRAILLFFNYIAWAMFAVGLVIAVFETAIAYQSGQGNIGGTFINILKGFMATSLVTKLPIELYRFSITLQTSLSKSVSGIISSPKPIGELALGSVTHINALTKSTVFMLFMLIAIGYAVLKVFAANIKRGGILLTQIAIGSLYMMSIPRGFNDQFIVWMKQVIALSITTFMQTLILLMGLLIFREHMMLGVGLMLSAKEVPRIADQFGLDTSARGNMMGALYATQMLGNFLK